MFENNNNNNNSNIYIYLDYLYNGLYLTCLRFIVVKLLFIFFFFELKKIFVSLFVLLKSKNDDFRLSQ